MAIQQFITLVKVSTHPENRTPFSDRTLSMRLVSTIEVPTIDVSADDFDHSTAEAIVFALEEAAKRAREIYESNHGHKHRANKTELVNTRYEVEMETVLAHLKTRRH